jgi:hypothetical protein
MSDFIPLVVTLHAFFGGTGFIAVPENIHQ